MERILSRFFGFNFFAAFKCKWFASKHGWDPTLNSWFEDHAKINWKTYIENELMTSLVVDDVIGGTWFDRKWTQWVLMFTTNEKNSLYRIWWRPDFEKSSAQYKFHVDYDKKRIRPISLTSFGRIYVFIYRSL